MTLWIMGMVFAAIGFVVAVTFFSLATILVWRTARPRLRGSSALFLLRMVPTIGASMVVLALTVPAFVLFEPRHADERPGLLLTGVVLVAAGLVLAGLYRGVASWRMTRRLERTWLSVAYPTTCDDLPVRAYRVPSALPFAGLVGFVRPRLFVSDRFFDALSDDERRAVLRHEAGHLRSGDNLKRLLIRLAPDWLALSSAGDEIEQAWAVAAEEAADDHAAGVDDAGGLAVAGALLKASRLVPVRLASVSNFCDGATIARRVARLIDDNGTRRAAPLRPLAFGLWTAGLLAATAAVAAPVLPHTHTAIESIVRLLR
jgi:hypothetical protein